MSQILQLLGSFKNLAYTLLPIVVPLVWRAGKSAYYTTKSPKYKARIHPLSVRNTRILALLLASAVLLLLVYRPLAQAAAVNVFQLTDARLQTPGEVIASRMRALYAGDGANSAANGGVNAGLCTAAAHARMPWALRSAVQGASAASWDRLFARLATLEGRVLYTGYGLGPLLHCDFCRTDAPWTFFLYALPTQAAPYLLNLLLVLAVTRGPRAVLTTTQAAQWSALFAALTLVVAGLDLGISYTFPTSGLAMANRRAVSRDTAVWLVRMAAGYRAYALAALDGALAAAVWLAGSGRAWDNSFTEDGYYRSTQRAVQALDLAVQRLRISTMLHSQVIARNGEFRAAYEQWGENEQVFDQKLRDTEQVRDARKSAQQRKAAILRNVEAEAQNMIDKL